MISVAEATKNILEYIPNIANRSTVEIIAHKGRVEIQGVKSTSKVAIDDIFLDSATETECTIINRAVRFNVYDGNCIVSYMDSFGKKQDKILNSFNSIRIQPNLQFILKTNGSKCCLVLVMEATNG